MTVAEIITMRIRALCKERRINLNQLAVMSDVSHSSLDNIVNGRSNNPTVLTLMKIANTLNMTVSEFLDIPELNNYYKDDIPGED